MALPSNILHRIRLLGIMKDLEVPYAADQLKGAIIRLRRQNPFRLILPVYRKELYKFEAQRRV